MFFVSRKKYEEEINKRIRDERIKTEEKCWKEERERNMSADIRNINARLSRIEKELNLPKESYTYSGTGEFIAQL